MASHKPHLSTKRISIDKANTTMFAAVGAAVFVVIFSVVTIQSLLSQSFYYNEVIGEKNTALKALEENRQSAESLRTSYQEFAAQEINVLGGTKDGTRPLDGDNAKIVLDALPSIYDYPAVSTSIEKILVDGGYQIQSIGGAEDPSQIGANSASNTAKDPIEIPYPFTVQTSPDQARQLLETLESSIRPFTVTNLTLTGQGDILTTAIGLKTYYQPASGLEVIERTVR